MKDGLRPATVTKVLGMLNTVLAYAKRRGYIYDNPAADVGMPDNTSTEVPAFEGRYLTPAEFQKLVESAEFFNPMYGLVGRLLGTTGMRVGELAGLSVGDVHILGSRGQVKCGAPMTPATGSASRPRPTAATAPGRWCRTWSRSWRRTLRSTPGSARPRPGCS